MTKCFRTWEEYTEDQNVDLAIRLNEALDALQMLVDKVDRGEARSTETVALHRKILQKNGRSGKLESKEC